MVKNIILRLDNKEFKHFVRKKTAMGLSMEMNISWETFFKSLINDETNY